MCSVLGKETLKGKKNRAQKSEMETWWNVWDILIPNIPLARVLFPLM